MTGTTKNALRTTTGLLAALGLIGCGWSNPSAGEQVQRPSFETAATADDDASPDDVLDDEVTGKVATLRGFVKDPRGVGIGGVLVHDWEGWSTETDANGRFELPDVDDGTEKHMVFEKEGYAGSFGVFRVMADGSNFFAHVLAPVDVSTNFDAGDGVGFTIDDTHEFTIPGDVMETLDGEAYDGDVHVNATVWDRKTPLDEGGEFLASPGNGRGITTEGDDQLLFTFGMFQLEFTADDGTPLQPGPGVELVVEVPADSGFQDGDSVPYWQFDDSQNTWIEEDQGQITDLGNGEQVWEFVPTDGLAARSQTGWIVGNPDHPVITWVSGQAEGTVTDPQGSPQANVSVRVVSADQTFMQATQTDANGNWAVNVPPVVSNPFGPNGRPLFLEIDYEVAQKPSLWRDNPIAPPGPGGTVSFGTSVVGSMSCLAGNVLDASGAPVAGIDVLSPHGGNAQTGSDGSFCMAVPKWQPSTIYAAPTVNSVQGYEPRTFRPVVNNGGSCDTSCPNQVTLRAYPATV